MILGIGPQTHFLLSIRKKLGLEDNIDILDFTQEHAQMYRYLKSSKIFVLLSKLEGFSISAFEAMAAGLPILTINAPKNALKDYVENPVEAPFMIMAFEARKNKIKEIPSAIHVDGTLRPQTVRKDINEK